MEQSSTSKIKLPNKELVGVKKEKDLTKEDSNKLPQPTGWRLLVLPFKMKGKTNILQPVGCGSFSESCFDKSFSFLTPTNSLFGSFIFDIDDCSMLLLIF